MNKKELQKLRKKYTLWKKTEKGQSVLKEVLRVYGKFCYICHHALFEFEDLYIYDLSKMCYVISSYDPRSNYLLGFDHLIPLYKNGQNTLENLRPCCNPCNSKKGKR